MVEARTQQSGRLEDVSPLDLLQSLGIYRRAGHVGFVHPQGRSRLWFEAGEIIDAQSGALRGEAALYRIATHDRGAFRVEITGQEHPRTIERRGSALVFEAAHRLDEGNRLRAVLPTVDAVLTRPPAAVPISSPTEEHRRVAAMLEAGATLGEVLERSGLGELETLQWLVELSNAGQLAPTGAVRSPEPPEGDALAGPGWPIGLDDASRPFVPSPSYAGHDEDEAPAKRRWWIPAAVGAAVVAVVLLMLEQSRDGSIEATAGSTGVAPVAVSAREAAAPSPRLAEQDERAASHEPSLAVGAAIAEHGGSGPDRGMPSGSAVEPLPSAAPAKLGRRSGSRSPSAPTASSRVQAERPRKPEDARSRLAEARRAYAAGRGEAAYRLASQSQWLSPTDEAAELMVLAACLQRRVTVAAEALRAVPLLRRGSVRQRCKQEHGVRIKLRGAR